MPGPATAQAIRAPAAPVSCANLRGREKTPAPAREPTTMVVGVGRVSLAVVVRVSVAACVTRATLATNCRICLAGFPHMPDRRIGPIVLLWSTH